MLVAALLVAAAVVLLGGEDSGGDRAAGQRGRDNSSQQPSDGPSDDASGDAGNGEEDLTEGSAGGVALPLLDGWTEQTADWGVAMSSGSYPCPRQQSTDCADAGVSMYAVQGLASSPQEAAEADISDNASSSYSEESYGGIDSQEEVRAEEVTVAGQDGYRIRWRIGTAAGTEAYVESVAFPAADDSGAMVVLRLGFDIGGGAPPAGDMDRIVAGARAASGGPGTDV